MTVTITTKELLHNFIETAYDAELTLEATSINHLIHGCMPGIRDLFEQGNTMILMGKHFEAVDNSIAIKEDTEVRITHNNRLIGILVGDELVY